MANITNELTGRASGKVGNLVYRITNGQTSLCSAPLKPKPATDPKVIARRNRFRMALRLASAMNRIAPLKTLWKNTEILGINNKLSPFSKMIRKNYPYVTETGVSDNLYLGPTFGFTVMTTDVSVSDSAVNITIDPIGNSQNIDTNIEKYIALAGVFMLTDPVDVNIEKYIFHQAISGNVALNLVNPLSFSISLEGDVNTMFGSYDTTRAFFVLLTLDQIGNPVRFSETFIGS